jgi:four helix bundle protein
MEVVKSYKDLLIWKKGMEISASVYKLTNDFSEDEKFGLISQLRRATVSVPSNIAEGYGRGSTKSYIQFVKISRGSLYEVETQLLLAFKLGFIKNEELYIEILVQITEMSKMISAFIKKLEI